MRLRDAVTEKYASDAESVASGRRSIADPQDVVLAIGVGRVAIGTTFLLAPRLSVRILGVDTASAKRMTFLARMTAARDIGLGAGTLDAASSTAVVPWLMAGAAADAVDALALAGAMKRGVVRGVPAAGTVVGAAMVAAVGVWAARAVR
ncbi:MAG TPA: hypothetical protein VGH43_20600 [Jatrophihabitans sp.]|jgi:hypothetical protein